MQINAFGVFLTNREAVQIMLQQPLDAAGLRGTVVNVGSVLDRSPSPVAFRDDRLRRQQGGRPGDHDWRPLHAMPRTGSGSTCSSPA